MRQDRKGFKSRLKELTAVTAKTSYLHFCIQLIIMLKFQQLCAQILQTYWKICSKNREKTLSRFITSLKSILQAYRVVDCKCFIKNANETLMLSTTVKQLEKRSII